MNISANKTRIIGTWIIAVIITLVSLHSVEEIHYLKSFFPRSFTVQEAYYASLIELIKVFLVAFPLVTSWMLIKSSMKK